MIGSIDSAEIVNLLRIANIIGTTERLRITHNNAEGIIQIDYDDVAQNLDPLTLAKVNQIKTIIQGLPEYISDL